MKLSRERDVPVLVPQNFQVLEYGDFSECLHPARHRGAHRHLGHVRLLAPGKLSHHVRSLKLPKGLRGDASLWRANPDIQWSHVELQRY
ncbi:hypothetical protein QQF64_007394 [Cirrhinus molitorella]|uniref:Uncharacterized protein n=1 Tax=Cirrhinus molitorella TaxID=172907 RepID=A0ABR3MAH7_9TELE